MDIRSELNINEEEFLGFTLRIELASINLKFKFENRGIDYEDWVELTGVIEHGGYKEMSVPYCYSAVHLVCKHDVLTIKDEFNAMNRIRFDLKLCRAELVKAFNDILDDPRLHFCQ